MCSGGEYLFMYDLMRKQLLVKLALPALALMLGMVLLSLFAVERPLNAAESGDEGGEMKFKRIPLQFIAALGAPDANSGAASPTRSSATGSCSPDGAPILRARYTRRTTPE